MELDKTFIYDSDFEGIESLYLTSTASKEVDLFEADVAHKFNLDHNISCVATNSGSSALFLALKAYNIGRGDYVYIPNTTYVATANVVLETGATPVLIPVNEDDWCMDLNNDIIQKRILDHAVYTFGKKVCMPVHLYGVVPQYDDHVYDLFLSRGIDFIFDSCHSFSETIDDRFTHCYSFNGNKMITTGGGGMVVCSHGIAAKIRRMIHPSTFNGCAFNRKMTGLSAHLGRKQLKHIYVTAMIKDNIADMYRQSFEGFDEISLQLSEVSSNWYFPIMLANSNSAYHLRDAFSEAGIPFRDGFMPLSYYPHLRSFDNILTPNTDFARKIHYNAICLPVATSMMQSEQQDVINLILKTVGV